MQWTILEIMVHFKYLKIEGYINVIGNYNYGLLNAATQLNWANKGIIV